MAFWKKATRTEPEPLTPPPPQLYVCNNDLCDRSLVGEVAEKLAYGCFLCSPPTRFDDLPVEVRRQIPLHDIALLWPQPVPCPFHPGGVLRPWCSVDYFPIHQDGNIPPVGIYGFSSAGKTVFCAALMMELEKLFDKTGILNDPLFDRGQYIDQVVAPLQRGIVPEKTFGHRSLSLKLYRSGWFKKRVTFNDMGGENFEEWYSAKPPDDRKRIMLEHLLHVEDAIFLMSPESASGLGATVSRDLFVVVNRAIGVLREMGYLAHDDHNRIEDRLKRIQDIVTGFRYLFSGSGASLRPVAVDIAALVCGEDCDDLVDLLEEELMKVVEQMKVRSLEDQLGGLIRFLDAWSSRGKDNKFNQRLAITIGKTDLLHNVFGENLNGRGLKAAHDSLEEWHLATDRLNRLTASASKNEWQKALRQSSTAVQHILSDFGEERFVNKAKENFRDVGFFLVSSLGRDTESFLRWERGIPQQMSGESISAMGGGRPAVVNASPKAMQWSVGKRVQLNNGGYRHPEPQNVLWPLLWILTAN